MGVNEFFFMQKYIKPVWFSRKSYQNKSITVIYYNYQLNINSLDFTFCVELPIKANKNKLRIETSKSNERARFAGKKKVNAIKDGFLILKGMFKLFFSN